MQKISENFYYKNGVETLQQLYKGKAEIILNKLIDKNQERKQLKEEAKIE